MTDYYLGKALDKIQDNQEWIMKALYDNDVVPAELQKKNEQEKKGGKDGTEKAEKKPA